MFSSPVQNVPITTPTAENKRAWAYAAITNCGPFPATKEKLVPGLKKKQKTAALATCNMPMRQLKYLIMLIY